MKEILAWIISVICCAFPTLTALSVINSQNVLPRVPENYGIDCIHFLSTGNSDAILLESGGHFALVDAGEDSDNPRGFDWLVFDGHEEDVLAYLKSHAADENGKVHLDFVLGTHAHSDHIGGFDTVILALGSRPYVPFDAEGLAEKVYTIGDADAVKDAKWAIYKGYRTAMEI